MILAAHGPVELSHGALPRIVAEATRGNATLIGAVVAFIRSREWTVDQQTISEILGGRAVASVRTEERRRLAYLVPSSGARQLLYRLSLVVGPLDGPLIGVI